MNVMPPQVAESSFLMHGLSLLGASWGHAGLHVKTSKNAHYHAGEWLPILRVLPLQNQELIRQNKSLGDLRTSNAYMCPLYRRASRAAEPLAFLELPSASDKLWAEIGTALVCESTRTYSSR
eukprot:TRINITY_DN2822_c0_g1_i2.p1 TRINITY_DN2822_c0_g1~~TRINITY_DN2822_c0_g1_i2.p1  ORF type:complete len:122 (+),score=15.33 TRINITY_DN2822_c0_g1_i2:117-482(+)